MRLFRQFILRHLARQRLRAAATVGGIALGVAVIIAIRLANASSIRGFEEAIEAISGRASLLITAPATGLDEDLLPDLAWLRDFGDLAPVIEADAVVRTPRGTFEPLRVLGIDILRDRPFRDYRMNDPGSAGQPRASEFLALVAEPDSILLTTAFADRVGIATNDGLDLIIGDRVRRFRVRGLLDAGGPADAMGGNVAVMDIAVAQAAFERLGRLDRLEIRLSDDRPVDRAEQAIASRLPAGLSVERPERRGRQVETMLAAFQFNLAALAHIALLVGLFLVYNTVAISVIARREEIGMLRALGVARRQVLGLFVGEAAVLAAAGCAIGVALGPALARAAVGLTGRTVTVLYVAAAAAEPRMEWRHVLLAIGAAFPLALLAAVIPAVEASRVPPTAVIRGSDLVESGRRGRGRQLLAAAACFGAAWILSGLEPVGGLPVFGFVAALAIVFGAAWLVPSGLDGLIAITRRPLLGLLPVEGRLARASLAGGIPRISISVAALAISLAMMVAVAIMVGSFRETVDYWVGQTLKADLYVAPSRGSRGAVATISEAAEQAVRRHPDVAAVDTFRAFDIEYGGALAILGAGDFATLLAHGNLLFKAPADGPGALRGAIGRDAVVVSESVAVKHRKAVGDTLRLPTPGGHSDFQIAAVYYDYSSDRGVIVMDRSTFTRHFGEHRPTSLSVYLRPGASPDAVREAIIAGLGDRHRLFIHTNVSLRRQVLRIFDSTFAITYALEAIAVFVAIMGIAGTMLTLVLERRRELGVLRLVGASRDQLRRMILIEAGLIGIAGQALGILVGLLLSLVLIYVINVQSFGWSIQFHLPTAFLVQSSVLVLAATAISGLLPARFATRLDPIRQVVEA